jgi:hypothetical protein
VQRGERGEKMDDDERNDSHHTKKQADNIQNKNKRAEKHNQ